MARRGGADVARHRRDLHRPGVPSRAEGQRVQAVLLSAFSAAQIVKAYVEHAGSDPLQFACDSLRSHVARQVALHRRNVGVARV
jgi:hypothetical protein